MRTTSRKRVREQAARERDQKPAAVAEPTDVRESEPAPEAKPANAQNRIGVALRDDGTIDINAMRESTRERLKRALNDPTLSQRIGLTTTSGVALPPEFSERIADILHDTMSKLVAVAVARNGYPPDQVRMMLLTPEERGVLNPLLGSVINEWMPAIDGKYQSLALLGLGYMSVYQSKFMQLRKPGEVIGFPSREQPQPTSEQPS